MYYRVKCLQTNQNMGWGYNSTSLHELCNEYLDYKSIDWDEYAIEQYYRNLSIGCIILLINDDEFEIEKSNIPFYEEI